MNKKEMAEKIKRKNTIKWNLINSALAGGLVFIGTAADGDITLKGICIAFMAGVAVALNKFQDFWDRRGNKIAANLINLV